MSGAGRTRHRNEWRTSSEGGRLGVRVLIALGFGGDGVKVLYQ
jgi:hypothetical protein